MVAVRHTYPRAYFGIYSVFLVCVIQKVYTVYLYIVIFNKVHLSSHQIVFVGFLVLITILGIKKKRWEKKCDGRVDHRMGLGLVFVFKALFLL